MSKISLKHSGGNVVSLNSPTNAPASADVAFKLPNADGSAGQVMKTDGSGNLSFGAATDTNDFVKLQSVTATTEVANFTFDSLDTTTYQAFKLILSMTPSNESSVSIRFRWRSGGSALTADEYNWANLGVSGAGNYFDNAGEDTSGLFTYSAGQQTGEGYRMVDATIIPKTSGDFQQSRNSYYVQAQRYDAGASHRGETNWGTYNINVNPDGFMIYPTTGNFKNYSYVLYGLKR